MPAYINNRDTPPPFRIENWSRTLKLITQIKTDYCFSNNIKLSEEKETATVDDKVCLASVCIWDGKASSAEFLHFITTASMFAGRGSDIANSQINDVTAESKNLGLMTCHHLYQVVTRFKTTTRVKHVAVPHRDGFLLCFYFSLAYNLVMNGSQINRDQKLFPTFASKMFNKDGQVVSKVSEHFNAIIDLYFNVIFSYFEGKIISCHVMFHLYTKPIHNVPHIHPTFNTRI